MFVYGTLKRGEPNHHWITNEENGTAVFVGTGKTKEIYPLVIASSYNIPFLLDKPGTGHVSWSQNTGKLLKQSEIVIQLIFMLQNIHGEVYRVDGKMLGKLDTLEEHPTFYVRRPENVILDGQAQVIQCWTYFLVSFLAEMLTKPYLTTYSASGPQGLEYVARQYRDLTKDHRREVRSFH